MTRFPGEVLVVSPVDSSAPDELPADSVLLLLVMDARRISDIARLLSTALLKSKRKKQWKRK